MIHGPSIGLFDRAVAYNQTRCGRHYTPTISRKGFSSSRVAYYPNSVSSFQTSFLMRSGDINPNPGPVNSSAANPEPRQDGFNLRGLHTFYANARSIVNKLDLLELEMSQRNYDLIVLRRIWTIPFSTPKFSLHTTLSSGKMVRPMAVMAVVC